MTQAMYPRLSPTAYLDSGDLRAHAAIPAGAVSWGTVGPLCLWRRLQPGRPLVRSGRGEHRPGPRRPVDWARSQRRRWTAGHLVRCDARRLCRKRGWKRRPGQPTGEGADAPGPQALAARGLAVGGPSPPRTTPDRSLPPCNVGVSNHPPSQGGPLGRGHDRRCGQSGGGGPARAYPVLPFSAGSERQAGQRPNPNSRAVAGREVSAAFERRHSLRLPTTPAH